MTSSRSSTRSCCSAPARAGAGPGCSRARRGPPTPSVAAGESPLDAISAAAARADQSGRYPDGIVLNGATFAACMAVKASTPDNYLVPPVTYPSPVFRGTTLRLAICGAMADGEALLGSFASSAKLDTAN